MFARVFAAVAAVLLLSPASVRAQQSSLICNLVLTCGPSAVPRWTGSYGPNSCFCQFLCNNDSDCPSGQICGDQTGMCDTGTRPPPPPPQCTKDADCPDDHNACDGREVCIAGTCGHTDRPTCDDGNPATVDFCSASLGGCQHDPQSCAPVRIVGPSVSYAIGTAPGSPRAFRVNGALAARFSDKAPFEMKNAAVHVIVGDKFGRKLVDATARPQDGAWSADGKGGWTWKNKDAKAALQTVHFSAHDKQGQTFAISGTMAAENLSYQGAMKPAFAVYVSFPGSGATAEPCAAVSTPVCLPKNMDQGRFMVCNSNDFPGR